MTDKTGKCCKIQEMITFSVINAQKKYDNIVRNFNTFWNKKRENPLILGRKSAIIRLELNDNS
jgi:hypothetical protein